MKKILISLVACAGLLTSCDMDVVVPGAIEDTSALTVMDNATNMRNFLYSQMRAVSTGAYTYSTAIQMDQFIGMRSNGNRNGYLSTGNITPSLDVAESLYSAMYGRIANANFFLENTAQLLASVEGEDLFNLQRYVAEAHFARAYYYFILFDHYCQTYTPALGDQEGLGLSIVTHYAPTYISSNYPGRSTMNETLKLIYDDLDAAYAGLKAYEEAGNDGYCVAGASYLSSYTVCALQARIALVTGNYETAVEKAETVIANKSYKLAGPDEYIAMWEDQNVDELIFAPYVDSAESGTISSTFLGYNYYLQNATQSDYIPTDVTVLEYCDENGYFIDYRGLAFFDATAINVQGGTAQAYIFNKFKYNTTLNAGTSPEYLSTPKPFRLSEQYLILAEAATHVSGGEQKALDAVNALRAVRLGDGYNDPVNLHGNELLDLIKAERGRELIGEGFRMSDLRRWKQGFKRAQSYIFNPPVAESFSVADLQVQYSNDDYRFVWPIPSSEISANPQIADQQNPGY